MGKLASSSVARPEKLLAFHRGRLPAVTRLAVAVAGAAVVIDAAWHGAAAQNPIAHVRDVRAALRE
jgi:hypothetical protein